MTLQRPHESLGIPVPMGRRLGEAGKRLWIGVFFVFLVACIGMYVFQVNASASKSYALHNLQRQSDRLKETVSVLENRVAEAQTMVAIEERMKGLGYVSTEQVSFIDVHGKQVSMVK
jgi:hypothetical protein